MTKQPIEITPARWFDAETNPKRNGWHPVLNFDGSLSYRLFEDGSWWFISWVGDDGMLEPGEWSLVPNNSFVYWADVEPMSVVTERALGSA